MAAPRVKKAKVQEYFVCEHEGCGLITLDARQMVQHHRRYRLHADHFHANGHACALCQQLVECKEWAPDGGGRDDFVCRHVGCEYYSSSTRVANRKQAVERHEVAFPIHSNHFDEHGAECSLCLDMVRNQNWESERAKWLVNRSQLVRRLSSKESQNCRAVSELPDADGAVYVRRSVSQSLAKRSTADEVSAQDSGPMGSPATPRTSSRPTKRRAMSDDGDDEYFEAAAPLPRAHAVSAAMAESDAETPPRRRTVVVAARGAGGVRAVVPAEFEAADSRAIKSPRMKFTSAIPAGMKVTPKTRRREADVDPRSTAAGGSSASGEAGEGMAASTVLAHAASSSAAAAPAGMATSAASLGSAAGGGGGAGTLASAAAAAAAAAVAAASAGEDSEVRTAALRSPTAGLKAQREGTASPMVPRITRAASELQEAYNLQQAAGATLAASAAYEPFNPLGGASAQSQAHAQAQAVPHAHAHTHSSLPASAMRPTAKHAAAMVITEAGTPMPAAMSASTSPTPHHSGFKRPRDPDGSQPTSGSRRRALDFAGAAGGVFVPLSPYEPTLETGEPALKRRHTLDLPLGAPGSPRHLWVRASTLAGSPRTIARGAVGAGAPERGVVEPSGAYDVELMRGSPAAPIMTCSMRTLSSLSDRLDEQDDDDHAVAHGNAHPQTPGDGLAPPETW